MQYNYQTQQLLDKGVNFATIYPEKQAVVKEMTGFDFDLQSIVNFLKKQTNDFTISLPLALEIDKNIVSVYNKYQVSQGKKADPKPEEPATEEPKVEEPSAPAKPTKEVLTTRLKIVKKMYDKAPTVVLKGRIKIIEKMLLQPEKYCCGARMEKGGRQLVAEVQYRDGANYKQQFVLAIPENKVGEVEEGMEEVDVEVFGISKSDWRDIIGGWDDEYDHYFLEIGKVRPIENDDVITNSEERKNITMETGGYVGKTAEQVWESWDSGQKNHFLSDHNDRKQYTPSSIEDLSKKTYRFLPAYYKNELAKHIIEGQYEEGGAIESDFEAIYAGKKIQLKGTSLYNAVLKAREQLHVPKSKQGLLSVYSVQSMEQGDFRYMAAGGAIETEYKRLNDELAKTERGSKERMTVLGQINLLKHNNPSFNPRGYAGGGKPGEYEFKEIGVIKPQMYNYTMQFVPAPALFQNANKLWAKSTEEQREKALIKYVPEFAHFDEMKKRGHSTDVPKMSWRTLAYGWSRDIAAGLHNDQVNGLPIPLGKTKLAGGGKVNEGRTYEVTDIEYDTDGEKVDLPKILTIVVPEDLIEDEEIDNYISDEISNITGYCHTGFKTKLDHGGPIPSYSFDLNSEAKRLAEADKNKSDYSVSIDYQTKSGGAATKTSIVRAENEDQAILISENDLRRNKNFSKIVGGSAVKYDDDAQKAPKKACSLRNREKIYNYEGVKVKIKPASKSSKKFIVWDVKTDQQFSNEKFGSVDEAKTFVKENKMKLVK